MNYFDYNSSQTCTAASPAEPWGEELVFTGDETIQVDEDHTVTVDDVRAYIRGMHDRSTGTKPVSIVPIRAA